MPLKQFSILQAVVEWHSFYLQEFKPISDEAAAQQLLARDRAAHAEALAVAVAVTGVTLELPHGSAVAPAIDKVGEVEEDDEQRVEEAIYDGAPDGDDPTTMYVSAAGPCNLFSKCVCKRHVYRVSAVLVCGAGLRRMTCTEA